MKVLFTTFLFLQTALVSLFAQGSRMGEWRVHLPYTSCKSLTVTQDDKLFVASDYGIFSYDIRNNNMEKLSTVNGFAGVDASVINHDPETNKTWIGYSNTKIDVIQKNRIRTLNDIFNSTLQGDRAIYDISFYKRRAYVSTGLGIVVYDQDKYEVVENYLDLGLTGNSNTVPIYASTVLGDTLFAVAGNKVMYGILSPSINLSDFSNWSILTLSSQSRAIVAFGGKLYAELDSVVQVWDGQGWQVLYGSEFGSLQSLRVHNQHLVITCDRLITVIRPDNSKHEMRKNGSFYGLVDKQNNFWHTTGSYGLVNLRPDSTERYFFPNGPSTITSFDMINYNGALWVTAGGHNFEFVHTYNFEGYNVFSDNRWTRNPYIASDLVRIHDFTNMAKHPSQNRLFIGTHGKGVIEFEGDRPVNVFKEHNSSLTYFDNRANDSMYYTTGIAFDKAENLWVTNYAMDSALHVFTKERVWKGIRLPTVYTGELLVDNNNYKWMITPNPNFSNAALCVFDDNNTPLEDRDDRSKLLNSQNLNLPTNLIRCFTLTVNNEIWLGTDAGLLVIRNPRNVFGDFPGQSFGADRIIVEQGGTGAYLLGSEVIYALKKDGGGRIWAGTNTGAWLIDKNGTDIIRHYNAQNSPLPSDNVYKIGIDEITGEVFFGTDKGLFSVKEDATKPADLMGNLKIYPNPVRPNFSGDISIEGLAFDARVKITDVNGHLVYETISNGGKAIWNGLSLSGQRPVTGVYLVFAMDAKGEQTAMGKILFVR